MRRSARTIAGAIALTLSILGTPLFIKVLERHGYGQFVRDDGPTTHATKRGTPTMGGVAIILAVLLAYLLTHLLLWSSPSVSISRPRLACAASRSSSGQGSFLATAP